MLNLYNTITRKTEPFKPIKEGQVGIYSCGPTVYNYAHIGNLRTYIFNDLLKRSLSYLGFKVTHVMNITDVDDKTIKESIKENLPLKEFTQKYEDIFFKDIKELNIIRPDHVLRATESIPEMVSLIKTLLEKGYAYKAADGIYFSINKFKKYGKLAQLEKIKATKARVKSDEYDKSNPQDFALWKFHVPEDGPVAWETEIGKGRPGWHIECSAMSMKILGPTLDIHTGASDLIFPHHTNEIAQSETATGKKFVNYWLHAGFLTMKEGKMAKSLGNVLYLKDLKEKGYQPIQFRYLCLLTHYRSPLAFSLENLEAAKNTYERLKRKIIELRKEKAKGKDKTKSYESSFLKAINDDLNMSQAIQVLWQLIDDTEFDSQKKLALLEKFDQVLGLEIAQMWETKIELPGTIKNLIEEREQARKDKNWKEADKIRDKLRSWGFIVEDKPEGPRVTKL